jgi:hypothetical protein
VPHITWEPCYFTKVPGGPQTYTPNTPLLQEKCSPDTRLSAVKASHLQRIWAEDSSSAPHLLHSGLPDSPLLWDNEDFRGEVNNSMQSPLQTAQQHFSVAAKWK